MAQNVFIKFIADVKQFVGNVEQMSSSLQNLGKGAIGKVVGGLTSLNNTMRAAQQSILAWTVAITGAYFAVTRFFNTFKEGTKLIDLAKNFDAVAKKAGLVGNEVIEGLKKVSAGVLDVEDSMRSATLGLERGLTQLQLEQLALAARAWARIAGVEVNPAFQQLVGIMTASRRPVLALAHTFLNINEVMKAVAMEEERLGRSLTALEQKQLAFNLLTEQTNKIMEVTGGTVRTASEEWEALRNRLDDIRENTLVFLGKGFLTLLDAVEELRAGTRSLIDAYMALGSLTTRSLDKSIASETEKLKKQIEETARLKVEIEKMTQAKRDAFLTPFEVKLPPAESTSVFTEQSVLEANRALTKMEADYKKFQDRKLESDKIKIQEWANENKKGFDMTQEFAIQTARGMQQTFQTFFFDVFTGQVKSMADVMQGLWHTVAGILSNIAAMAVTQKLFGGGGLLPVKGFQRGGLVSEPTIGLLHPGEMVIPANKVGSNFGGGVTVNQIFNISPGVPEAVRREIMALRPVFRKDAVDAFRTARSRGGVVASEVRG